MSTLNDIKGPRRETVDGGTKQWYEVGPLDWSSDLDWKILR